MFNTPGNSSKHPNLGTMSRGWSKKRKGVGDGGRKAGQGSPKSSSFKRRFENVMKGDGLVDTPATTAGEDAPWEASGPWNAKQTAITASGGVMKTTSIETTRVRPPCLFSVSASALRSFLAAHHTYVMASAVVPQPTLPLHLLIDPSIIGAIPRFVKNMLGHEDAGILPRIVVEDRICRFHPPLDSASMSGDEEGEDSDDSQLISTWEAVVFKAMRKAALGRLSAELPTVTFEEVSTAVKNRVKWPKEEISCTEALNSIVIQLESVEYKGGFKDILRGKTGNRKEFLKLFVSMIQPEKFQKVVKNIVQEREITTFDGICDIIVSLGQLYEGMIISERAIRDSRGGHSRGGSELGDSAKRPTPTPGQPPAAVSRSHYGGGSGNQGFKRRVPEKLPKQPCRHCGELHWSFACPKLKEATTPYSSAKATPVKIGTSPASSKLIAKAAATTVPSSPADGQL